MAKIQFTQGLEIAQLPVFPVPVKATRAPTSSDLDYDIGQVWARTDTAQIYILSQLSSGSASWTLASPGASDVDTLTGDSGGAISPSGGNITLEGGTNITTAGTGNKITFNLDAAIVLATSVSSPLYTVAAGNDLAITSASGQDIVIKMGDAAAANKVSFVDSADVEVAAIDSNGGFSMGAITFSGLLTASASATIDTAGTALNLATDNSGDDVNIAIGTVARDVHIADSAAAHTVTIGSTTGAASLDLQFGTGNFTLDGPATGTINMGASLTSGTVTIGGTSQTNNFVLGPSDSAMTMNIANGNGAKTINIGAGVDGNTISVGNGINTTAQTVNISGGAAGADSTVNILSGNATAGTQTLNLGTGNRAKAINIGNGVDGNTISMGNGINTSAQTINIANGASGADTTLNIMSGVGTAGAGVLAIGNNTRVTTIGLGNIAPAATRTTTIAGGDSAQDDTVNILNGAPSAGTQTVSVLSGNASGGTQVLNLGNGNRATAVNVGNGTGGNTILIANGVNGAAQTTSIANGASGADQTVNVLSGNAAAGTQTLNLAEGTGGKTVNIATGAGVNAVTVGSTNSTSSLTLQAGSNDITVSGTVKEIDAEFLFSSGTDLTVTQSPILQSNANDGAAPTGATGDVNLMYMQDGCLMEQFILGAGQTIIAPRMTSNGLNIALDQTATEGAEYNFGARNNAKHAYTIGTSAAFFMTATFYVEDLSGCNPLLIGFRKVEANNATFADYTDYVGIGLYATTSATNVVIFDELNAGGQTITDTTDAWGGDMAAQSVTVLVSATGVVTFEVGGSAASVAPAFTFDSGDVVMPYIRTLQGADLSGEIGLQNLKIGFQA